MKLKEEKKKRKNTREDRPGEAEKRTRMRSQYGINHKIKSDFDGTLKAVCENGVFVGKKTGDVISYKGIPYATPPVGELRWKPPMPPAKSDSVYEAYYFGKSPIQTEWPSEEGSYYPQGENCLTLNIWTADNGMKDKPVMVFFHGGSYGWGATSDPIYDGYNLVSENPDIILVTAEYRVGIMGFIDFSEVDGGEEYKESGNLGLLDHIRALEWVRDNISAFGGNADNVTIFGESAGGGTVSILPLIPQAKGLFRRVIAESGSVALTYSKKECLPLAKRLMNETGAENMEELIALTEKELMEVNEKLNDYNNFPERDGVVIPEDLYKAYEDGASKGVDMMFGTNADETCYWIKEMGYYSKDWLGPTVFKLGMPVMFGSNTADLPEEDKAHIDEFFSTFPKKKRKVWRIVEFYNDILFRVPATEQAYLHSKNGGKAYMYYWNYPSAIKRLGACHAVELSYVFGNLDVKIYTGDNVFTPLSEEVMRMWTNFARTGDPSTEKHRWEPYTEEKRNTAYFDREITFKYNPRSERRIALRPLLKYYFNGCYTNLSFKVPLIYKLFALIAVPIVAVIGIIPAVVFFGIRLIKKGFRRSKRESQ